MRKVFVVGLVLTLLGAVPALAATPAAGDKETSFSFSYTDTDLGKSNTFDFGDEKDTSLDGTLGWYITDHHEVGVIVSWFKSEFNGPFGNSKFDGNSLGAFYHFNFAAGESMTPYVGASFATIGGDAGDNYGTALGVEGGVKIYPWENGGFLVNVQWQQLSGETTNGIEFPDADSLGISGGVLVKWGS